jgi:hypothetical protein
MPPLKYQTEIDKLNPDFTDFEELTRLSFRWVFEDNNEQSYMPVYKDAERLKYELKKNKATFRGWALSFFETQNKAKETLLHILKDKPEIFKKLGTHISTGMIKKEDGLSEKECDERGHFDHFEYIDIDFSKTFKLVEKIAG